MKNINPVTLEAIINKKFVGFIYIYSLPERNKLTGADRSCPRPVERFVGRKLIC